MAWFAVVTIDTTVGTIVSAVVDLTRETNAVSSNFQVSNLYLVESLCVSCGLNDQLSDNANRLLWEGTSPCSPNFSHSVVSTTSVELENRDDFFVLNDVVQILNSTVDFHTFDSSANAIGLFVGDACVV